MNVCPECGASAAEIISGSSRVISCEKCGWCVATTWTEPINEDETKYVLFLEDGNGHSKEVLSAVSKVAECGFVAARNFVDNPGGQIAQCAAVEMKRKIDVLESAGVRFSVSPDFPY